MKIERVGAVLAGYRKTDPEMQRSFALVRVETDDGTVGWGEASTNWGHSYPTVFRAVIDDVCAGHLVGREPRAIRDRVAELRVALDGYLGWEGLTSQAIGAIETALWDVLGKSLGAPVHELLGARPYPIPLYGTGTTMFEQPADWHARYFDQCLALGFAGVKVRLGRPLDEDVEVVRVVREHIGPNKLLGVDSYWFHDPDTAAALARRIEPYGVHFFEEPIPQYQLDGLARLQRATPIRVAVGERVFSPRAFEELARRDAARVFEPDVTLAGGILACMEIAAIADRHAIEVIPHVGGPTVVGLAANLHWATAARVRICEYDIDPHQPMITDLGDNPGLALTDLAGGTITAPTGPGLGVEVDEARLADHPYVSGDTYAELFPEHESGRSAAGERGDG
ncbi:MAG: mandelate racemase/muconate lactonizing enzyme family protein [Actinomycetota bacterium]|nr:mandelate racemase/muconate lactonizing enzyme family protein [Actinomycetota bacterium]